MFDKNKLASGYNPFHYPIAHWQMGLDNKDGEMDDMTIGEYIEKKIK